MNLKKKILLLSYKPTKKRKRFHMRKFTWQCPKKEKISLYGKVTWQWPKQMRIWVTKCSSKSFFNFLSQKRITSFSYQHSISFTHGLQHYCFLGKANVYRLCGLWEMSRQIWTIFMVQKRFQLLGYKTQNLQERWQQRVPTGPKSYFGRGRFQPVFEIEELAGQCSRELY